MVLGQPAEEGKLVGYIISSAIASRRRVRQNFGVTYSNRLARATKKKKAYVFAGWGEICEMVSLLKMIGELQA